MSDPCECSGDGVCEFVIKDNIKYCVHCGRVEEIIPPMCEIVGECQWINFDSVVLCAQCGRIKPKSEGEVNDQK